MMKGSLHRRLDRGERRKRAAPKVRYVIYDGSSEEEGVWRGNYFLRRTPKTAEEWEAKYYTQN
jgi:hypothetical protein